MNMSINALGSSLESRIQIKFQELAMELASEIGIKEDELNILLEDPKIYEALRINAQAAIEDEDKRRKDEILAAAREKLGIITEKPKKALEPVALPVPEKPIESDWQKYLRETNHALSSSLAQLETREEISAARGFLIAALNRHRRNPDWMKDELQEAVGVWDQKAQVFLDVINNFFGSKKDVPMASSEIYSRVSSLVEGDRDLRWYMKGPIGIKAELDSKKNEQELAQQRTAERQQKKEALAGKKQKIIALLAVENIPGGDAEKLAAATIKKFPDLEIKEALLKMAINRQVSAIQQSREFLEKVAHEAQSYLLGSGESENKFFLEISQHPEVIALLKRDAADSRICRR